MSGAFLDVFQDVDTITAQKSAPGTARICLTSRAKLVVETPEKARELLAAAYEALAILDPDAAADALVDLIEGDAPPVIRRRVAAEEMRAQREAVANGAARVQEQLAAIKCGLCGRGPEDVFFIGGHGWRCADALSCRERMTAGLPGDDALDVAAGADPLAIPPNRIGEAAPQCAKCHAEPRAPGGPYGAKCLDMCHEALEFDHVCMICATPEERKALGCPAPPPDGDAPLEGCVRCGAAGVPLRPLTTEPGQVCNERARCDERREAAAKAGASHG